MFKNGIRYSDEFKQQIVNLYNSGQLVLELSREYGVAMVTIYKWIKQHFPVKIDDNKAIIARSIKQCKNACFNVKTTDGIILHSDLGF